MRDIRPKIAIINNNPVFVSLLATALQEETNADILALTASEDSYAQIQAQRLALIVVDIDHESPGSAWQIIDRIIHNPAMISIPLIICAVSDAALDQHLRLLPNHVLIISKPFVFDELLQTIHLVLPQTNN